MEKPSIKYANGKVIATAQVGVDKDKDGEKSINLKMELELDALEVVSEIVKDGAPQWLKDLVGKE